MWKLCVFLLLIYGVAAVISKPLEDDGDSYDGTRMRSSNHLTSDATFNLLPLQKSWNSREITRGETSEPPYLENWTGRWMPDRLDNGPASLPVDGVASYRPTMGQISDCDDGKRNLEVDWDGSDVDYICYGRVLMPEMSIVPLLHIDTIPYAYQAMHKCMNETIEYDNDVPTYGTHRPVYPVYGEYKFLPKQRWLHSLEHGAVVALYDPCADPMEVGRLKTLVKKCLRRHIISPYNLPDKKRPLALIAWGSRLTMSYVNPAIVLDFIRGKSLQGPEKIPEDGIFDQGLIGKSQIITDYADSTLCPNM